MTKNVMLSSMGRVLVARAVGRVLIVSCMLTLGAAFPAGAQDFRQAFSLSTPGARANAMGQAFIGVADDASAMITNPAGLVLLTRPQAYVEFKTGNELQDEFEFTEESPGSVSFLARLRRSAAVWLSGSPITTTSVIAFFNDDPSVTQELSGVSYAGTVAVAATQNISVGATIAVHKISLDDDFAEFSDDFSSIGGDIGVLWRASPIVSVGVNTAFASEDDDFGGEVMPNRFGAGAGVRPVARLLIAADVTWIAYSDLELADDATQFHMGGEYQLFSSTSNQVFARAGLFTVPDDEFGEGGGVTGTFGAGVTLGRHFQADFAVLTEGEVVVSAAVRF